MTTPTKEQQLYRSMVRSRGPLEIRRLHRDCPECGGVTLYCAERRFCGCDPHGPPGYPLHYVCADSLCIRCGWEGSTGASEGGTRRVEGNRKLRANSPRRPAKGRP